MRRDVIIFDTETVPDADAARRMLGQPELNDIEARDALSAYFLEKTDGRNDFPRQPFHQICTISYAHLIAEPGEGGGRDLVVRRIASGGEEGSSEAELLEGFFNLIETRAPQIVSFNGRGFDVPVLKYRAMIHSLACPRWFSEGDKWKNYDSRFDSTYHLDLLEVLSDYGASARCSMHEVATAFGVPGKLETSGDNVREMFEAGLVDDIRNYCETDVCTTLLIYLRFQRFNGALSEGAYARAVLGLRNYLEEEAKSRPHFSVYLSAWDTFEQPDR